MKLSSVINFYHLKFKTVSPSRLFNFPLVLIILFTALCFAKKRNNTLYPAGLVKITLVSKELLTKNNGEKKNRFYTLGFFLERDKRTVFLARTFDREAIKEIIVTTASQEWILNKVDPLPSSQYFKVSLPEPLRSAGLFLDCNADVESEISISSWRVANYDLAKDFSAADLELIITNGKKHTSIEKDESSSFHQLLKYTNKPLTGTPILRTVDGKLIGIFVDFNIAYDRYAVLSPSHFCQERK